jgi:hypothetical protein
MPANIFSSDGLHRIFEGELEANRTRGGEVNHYRVRGFHFEEAATMIARGIVIDEASRTSMDGRGVYRAGFTLKGSGRCTPTASGFFPVQWSREQVVSAIGEAYETRTLIVAHQRIYEGRTREGMKIRLWLDEADNILDAMPLRAKVNRRREAQWKLKRGLSKRSRHVCGDCQSLKVYVCPKGHRLPAPIGVAIYVERWMKKIFARGLRNQSVRRREH